MNSGDSFTFLSRIPGLRLRRGMAFGIIIIGALIAFEIFNYSTTDFALRDLLGDLRFAGVRWATILSLAFCGIDFAGIARLFTPEQGASEPNEVWYLFGAWILAATMNAILTWWGVSMAIINHQMSSSAVISSGALVKVVPIFVAVMVWLIRILIIGSLSYAGDHLFGQPEPTVVVRPSSRTRMEPALGRRSPASAGLSAPIPSLREASGMREPSALREPASAASTAPVAPAPAVRSAPSYPARPAPKPVVRPESSFNRPEPTYHSMSARPGSAPQGGENPSRPPRR